MKKYREKTQETMKRNTENIHSTQKDSEKEKQRDF